MSTQLTGARQTLQAFVQNPDDKTKSREARQCVLSLMHAVTDGTMKCEDFCRAFTTYEAVRESEALKEASHNGPCRERCSGSQ